MGIGEEWEGDFGSQVVEISVRKEGAGGKKGKKGGDKAGLVIVEQDGACQIRSVDAEDALKSVEEEGGPEEVVVCGLGSACGGPRGSEDAAVRYGPLIRFFPRSSSPPFTHLSRTSPALTYVYNIFYELSPHTTILSSINTSSTMNYLPTLYLLRTIPPLR